MLHYFTRNKKLIHYLITLLFFFLFPLIPPMPPLTVNGMQMLGIFIGVVYGWTMLDMLWPSIMGLVVMGFYIGIPKVLGASFGNPVVMMMIVMLVVMELLNKTKLTENLAISIISNKLTLGKPWMFMFLFFVGSYIGSIVNPIVTIMLFMTFINQICKSIDIPLRSPFTAVMAIGVGLSALLGQTSLPFYNAGLSYTMTYAAMFQTMIPYGMWIIFFIGVSMFLLASYVLLVRFVMRIDVTNLKNIDLNIFGDKEKLNADQKIAAGAFIAFLIIVCLSSFLPTTILGVVLNKFTTFGLVVIIAAVLMIMVKESGDPVFDFRKLAATGISWDVVFMVALIMPMAQFLTGEETGIAPFLAVMLQPLMGLPPTVFIILALALGALITNFANNFVVALVIMPVIYSFAMQTGINPMGPIMVLFVCTQIAIGTPGASFPIAICYSYANIVDAKMMMKYAWISCIGLIILCLAVALPIAKLLF